MYSCVLRHGLVVLPNESAHVDIAVSDGKIVCIMSEGTPAAAALEVDLTGKIVFPGLVDSHAHVSYCGDYTAGTKAAAKGGVTTLIEMPTSNYMPHVMDEHLFNQRIDMIGKNSCVDMSLWGGISPDKVDRINGLLSAGAGAFKVFMCDAGTYPSFSAADLLRLFRYLKGIGKDALIGVHAEVEEICAESTYIQKKSGLGASGNSIARPLVSELMAVAILCAAALEADARIHICHISSPQVIDLLDFFRKKGLRATAETCPHYLLLTEKDTERCGTYAKCAPPLRDAGTKEGLWERVLSGRVDIIGSDHASYSEKEKGTDCFWDAPGGFPGLDIFLPLLYEEGVLRRGLSLCQLAKITSSNAANAFGLNYCKGSVKPGMDADFAILDPERKWTYYSSSSNGYISPRYPYEGRQLHGYVEYTFVRGEIVNHCGFVSNTSGGKFIPAQTHDREPPKVL